MQTDIICGIDMTWWSTEQHINLQEELKVIQSFRYKIRYKGMWFIINKFQCWHIKRLKSLLSKYRKHKFPDLEKYKKTLIFILRN